MDARLSQQLESFLARGELAAALEHCAAHCRRHPDDIEAKSALATLQAQAGQTEQAKQTLEAVLARDPDNAEAYYNLGLLHARRQAGAEAEACYLQALRLRPDFAAAHFNLGNLYRQNKQWQKAGEHYRRALASQPDHFKARYNLGLIHLEQGEPAAACTDFAAAAGLAPHIPEPLYQLARALRRSGRPRDACAHLRRALQLQPHHPEVCRELGLALYESGALAEAETVLQRCLQQRPDDAALLNNLGAIALDRGHLDQAAERFQRALTIRPDFIAARINLGTVHQQRGELTAAAAHYERALFQDPDNAALYNNLGDLHRERGDFEHARIHYERALQLRPDYAPAHSNLLFTLSYNVLLPPADMLRAHRAWDQRFGGPHKASRFHHAARSRKRLRIGYLSPDLRRHPVSDFFEPLLAGHDTAAVEVFCYAEVKDADEVTHRLQGLAHHWRFTTGLDDLALARLIHEDQIDVLVDLAGHTAGNRLGACAYKPAPVQATYLGYFTTTGLTAMDYWITDPVLHPHDTVELASEQLHRLERCCLAYRPPSEAPPVVMREETAPLTFGCFNHLNKISPRAITLWSRILHALPGSRLLIKARQLQDEAARKRLHAQFAGHGIEAERLILRTHLASRREHLAAYGEVDIALDTLPRTGGATTAEALWMGVPVVTLAGARFIERLSATMLHALDLDDLIATSEEDYRDTAVALARDHARRRDLRRTLRDRFAASPLGDGRGLARALEQAYGTMWEQYHST